VGAELLVWLRTATTASLGRSTLGRPQQTRTRFTLKKLEITLLTEAVSAAPRRAWPRLQRTRGARPHRGHQRFPRRHITGEPPALPAPRARGAANAV
jgi:hypothetical protein